jgi:phosphoglycerate dehydrogenase-like enzyme
MKLWKNTTFFDDCNEELSFTDLKNEAEIAILGSKPITLNEFKSLKAIFRVGIGKDNVPEKEASEKGITVRFPSDETVKIIYKEAASFTCSLILKMAYNNVGKIDPWQRTIRKALSEQTLLIIGMGNIGSRVKKRMENFMNITTYDIIQNKEQELESLISRADYLTLHIPKNKGTQSFFDEKKLSWIKAGATLINTSRGSIVDEDALYNELKDGRLNAAFDVFWNEPYNGKLMEFYPNSFYMSPHVSSSCNEFIDGCKTDLDLLIAELT